MMFWCFDIIDDDYIDDISISRIYAFIATLMLSHLTLHYFYYFITPFDY